MNLPVWVVLIVFIWGVVFGVWIGIWLEHRFPQHRRTR